MNELSRLRGLYQPAFEKDSCGFGLIANIDNQPSHWLIETSISALARLTHRGAIAADGKTGDGCGLLIKKPDSFLRLKANECSIDLESLYAVAMVFMQPDDAVIADEKSLFAEKLEAQGLAIAGWREVPTDSSACGDEALTTQPAIFQAFINAPDGSDVPDFERSLFIARRQIEKAHIEEEAYFYIPSMSSRVLSYKGLVMPANLPVFYPDLNDPAMETSICLFHQRFSTNTLPQWKLAQPFRYLAHNGEINTIRGNRNWANARAGKFESKLITDMTEVQPLVNMSGSDSSSMDNMLDVLLSGGIDVFRAMRLLVPPAWQNVDNMDSAVRAFYEYNSMHMEPWDGPAGIVLTEGRYACCVTDRNGLRPARWVRTKDRHITLASEVGVWDYLPEDVVAKGRLMPGEMLAVDTESGRLLLSDDIDQMLSQRHPYEHWLHHGLKHLSSDPSHAPLSVESMEPATLERYEKLFQVSYEEKDQILGVLATDGQEAIGSMGDDTPLPVLSRHVRSLYDTFRQSFAQVTNPPIDPLREKIVMSLETCFGRERNLFDETGEHANRLVTNSPILSDYKFHTLMHHPERQHYGHERIRLSYDPQKLNLEQAIIHITDQAESAIRQRAVILVLSDHLIPRNEIPVHAALATGAVHHRLCQTGLRCDANLIVETGTARDPHHMAVLLGYGATAIYPYLAYASLLGMV